jgi:peroxiredoxin
MASAGTVVRAGQADVYGDAVHEELVDQEGLAHEVQGTEGSQEGLEGGRGKAVHLDIEVGRDGLASRGGVEASPELGEDHVPDRAPDEHAPSPRPRGERREPVEGGERGRSEHGDGGCGTHAGRVKAGEASVKVSLKAPDPTFTLALRLSSRSLRVFIHLAFASLLLMTPPSLAEEIRTLTVGNPALVFTLPQWNLSDANTLPAQEKLSLLDYVGLRPSQPVQALVLCFFDSNDGGPLIKSLNTVARQYRTHNVKVLGIDISTTESLDREDQLRAMKPAFPILRDNYHVVADRYGVRQTPLVYVIDAQGFVYAVGLPSLAEIPVAIPGELDGLLKLAP